MSNFALVLFVALIVGAMAFKSPVKMGRVATRAVSSSTTRSMSPVEVVTESSNALAQFSQMVAAESDFGGYAGPAGSLLLIGFLILTLSPPLKQKDDE